MINILVSDKKASRTASMFGLEASYNIFEMIISAQCFVVVVTRLLFRDYSVLTATKVLAFLIVCYEPD